MPRPTPSQFIWLAIAFGALYLLMSRIALPRIANILEERHDRIADDREEAARLTAESEAAAVAYEKALAAARGKAQGIAGETRDKLSAEAETKRKTLEAELFRQAVGRGSPDRDDQGIGDVECPRHCDRRGEHHRQ
jgi:F-type H+-transporting ATPase subunit b